MMYMQIAAWFALAVLLVMLLWLCTRRPLHKATRKMVFDNLDSAYCNGQFNEGAYLRGMSPEDVAYDLACYAVDCEHLDADYLAPYVRAWFKYRGMRS